MQSSKATAMIVCAWICMASIPPQAFAAPPVTGGLYVTSNNEGAVFRVNSANGNRTIVSSPSVGSGPDLVNPSGIAMEGDGSLVVVSSNSSPAAVIRVDPVTGARTVVSSANVGSGPNFLSPQDIAVEASGDLLITENFSSLQAVIRISPVTGNRTIVSSSTVGAGPNFNSIEGIAVEPDGKILVVDGGAIGPSTTDAILRVDPSSGNRVIISSMSVGTGPDFVAPISIAIAPSGVLYVTDATSPFGSLLAVNGAGGNRTVTSSSTVGTGPNPDNPQGLAIEADAKVVAASQLSSAIIRINPATGNRTTVTSTSVGLGPELPTPMDIVVVEPGVDCGNGSIDPPEQCDDGNNWDGDGCSAFCTSECVTNLTNGNLSCAMKKFRNTTEASVNDIEWLIEGSYSSESVPFHYDGPVPGQIGDSHFSSFTVTPSGSNTLLRWSGDALILDGDSAMVGFHLVAESIKTLSVFWSVNGDPAGPVKQVRFTYPARPPVLLPFPGKFKNPLNVPPQTLYVGNIHMEWFADPVSLLALTPGEVRSPLGTADLEDLLTLPPGVEESVNFPLSPADARFLMVQFTVSDNPSLAGPANTVDYVVLPLQSTAVPALSLRGELLTVGLILAATYMLMRHRWRSSIR